MVSVVAVVGRHGWGGEYVVPGDVSYGYAGWNEGGGGIELLMIWFWK